MPTSEDKRFLLRCATPGCHQVGVLTLVYCCDGCAEGGAAAVHSPRCVSRTQRSDKLIPGRSPSPARPTPNPPAG
jgi:hypothetical protein